MSVKTCPVNLKPHQKPHVKTIWDSITKQGNFSYMDVSKTGLGKTHATLSLAWYLQKKYRWRVAIVAANSQALESTDGWNNWAKQYDVDLFFSMTYSKLRQHDGHIHHKWLSYNHFTGTYSATMQFEIVASQGLFLIFDEVHKSTRKSGTHKACSALVRSCYRNKNMCRIGLLSFTPGDMPEHYPQILKMLGIMQHRQVSVYDKSTRTHHLNGYGFGDLVRYCKQRDPYFNAEDYLSDKITTKSLLLSMKKIFQEKIHKSIVFAMPEPPKQVKVEMVNMFMETDPSDIEVVNQGIELLKRSVRWRQRDNGEWDMGGVFIGLRIIELGKLNIIARYVREESMRNPNKKFIITAGARDLKHQYYLQKILTKQHIPDDMYIALRLAQQHSPLWRRCVDKNIFKKICTEVARVMVSKPVIMNGKTPNDKRCKIIDQFQSPKNDIWCLIVSPGIGSESISLHDTHGNHPRDIVISPDHFHTRLVQTAGRIDRVGVKSDCKIVMIYSKEANVETSILDSMIRKSQITKELHTAEQQKHEKFPAQYDYFIEGDRDIDLEIRLEALQVQ